MAKIIYDIDKIPESDDFDGDDENIKLKLYEEDKEYENDWEFNISLSQDKNCCGIISLGNFYINEDTYNSDFTDFQKKKLIRMAFDKLLDNFTNDKEKLTFMFTTIIEDEATELVESVVSKHPKFKLVSTFQNLNTGNTNKMYINK